MIQDDVPVRKGGVGGCRFSSFGGFAVFLSLVELNVDLFASLFKTKFFQGLGVKANNQLFLSRCCLAFWSIFRINFSSLLRLVHLNFAIGHLDLFS